MTGNTTIPPMTLEDEHVRLEPLTPAHAPALFAVADPPTFRYMPSTPEPWDETGFRAHLEQRVQSSTARCFAVVAKPAGAVVGTTSFLDIEPQHRSLEIGWTWLAPIARGTRVNPAMKRLMLAHALETPVFNSGPAIRVTLKADARNERSVRAMASLGFVAEGVLRQHRLFADGYRRDSAMFSVIDTDWPAVRATLDAAIAAKPPFAH